jgi:hypothetical protein
MPLGNATSSAPAARLSRDPPVDTTQAQNVASHHNQPHNDTQITKKGKIVSCQLRVNANNSDHLSTTTVSSKALIPKDPQMLVYAWGLYYTSAPQECSQSKLNSQLDQRTVKNENGRLPNLMFNNSYRRLLL